MGVDPFFMGNEPFMFSFMSTAVPLIVTCGFIFVFGMIIINVIKGIGQWNKNNNSPVLTVSARVVTKRTDVSHRHHHDNDNMSMSHSTSSTYYYATFEVESGDRIELGLKSNEFGLIAEGDCGRLTFQGTRYKGFERDKSNSKVIR